MEDKGENEYRRYNELISLDDGYYYVQGAQDSETEFLQVTRPVEALLEIEKENLEDVSERYL